LQSIFWLDNDEHYPLDMVEVSTLDNLMYKNLADRFYKKEIEEWEIEDQKSGDSQDLQEVRR